MKGMKSDKILNPGVALGSNRAGGSSLGAFCVIAGCGQSASGGHWRSRLNLFES